MKSFTAEDIQDTVRVRAVVEANPFTSISRLFDLKDDPNESLIRTGLKVMSIEVVVGRLPIAEARATVQQILKMGSDPDTVSAVEPILAACAFVENENPELA
jgi:hypothetical protein